MNILNFKKLEIENATTYKKIELVLQLNGALDLKFSDFITILERQISVELEKIDLESIKDAAIFQIKTDLPRMELNPLTDLILSTFARLYVFDKSTFKHKERILGVPVKLAKTVMPDIALMDLVNFNLPKENFTIQLYDSKDRMLIDITQP